jgi:hypothetical protein
MAIQIASSRNFAPNVRLANQTETLLLYRLNLRLDTERACKALPDAPRRPESADFGAGKPGGTCRTAGDALLTGLDLDCAGVGFDGPAFAPCGAALIGGCG